MAYPNKKKKTLEAIIKIHEENENIEKKLKSQIINLCENNNEIKKLLIEFENSYNNINTFMKKIMQFNLLTDDEDLVDLTLIPSDEEIYYCKL